MDNDLIQIANKIANEGGRLYLVGGAIRDKILKKQITDEDYCVVGVDEQSFIKLFPEASYRGKSFGVFEINNKEFALARTEKKTGVGHKQFEIVTDKNISIEQDLLRRDITINSMAQDVLTGKIIDPFGGKQDLNDKIIRATSRHFLEDPLRAYRVARFATVMQFDVELETINMMRELKSELKFLSSERVYVEFSKALSQKKPSIFFEVLKKADILDIHFKEIYDLIGALQPIEHHPEGDSFNHTMLVVDKSAEFTDILEIRFAALVHDLGKGITPKEEYPHHYGHEINGVELVKKFGENLKVPSKWVECGKVACREHMRGGIFYKMRPSKKVDFIERVSKSAIGLDGMQIVVNSDKLSSRNVDSGSIDFASIGKKCLEKIDGKFIIEKYGKISGVEFGRMLHEERIKWISSI